MYVIYNTRKSINYVSMNIGIIYAVYCMHKLHGSYFFPVLRVALKIEESYVMEDSCIVYYHFTRVN